VFFTHPISLAMLLVAIALIVIFARPKRPRPNVAGRPQAAI